MDNIESKFLENFDAYKSTLNKTSYDDKNDIYLCNDKSQEVYDFDKIVREKYSKPLPSSPDALMFKNKDVFLVEFKNQDIKRIKANKLKNKLTQGKEIIDEIFSELKLDINEYNFNFCVVYKNEENKIRRGIKQNIVRFDLKQYAGIYFDEVFTNDVQFFTNEYKKYFQKALKC